MNFKDSIIETLLIVKTCLTTVWFWIPVLFGVYIWAQLGIMFFIHPLALCVLPAILVAYSFYRENKRSQIQIEDKKFDVDKTVSQYITILKDEDEDKE